MSQNRLKGTFLEHFVFIIDSYRKFAEESEKMGPQDWKWPEMAVFGQFLQKMADFCTLRMAYCIIMGSSLSDGNSMTFIVKF